VYCTCTVPEESEKGCTAVYGGGVYQKSTRRGVHCTLYSGVPKEQGEGCPVVYQRSRRMDVLQSTKEE